MRTRTRDTSAYGYEYMSGLLRMETGRTIVDIARQTGVGEQNMQHFMSNSPWSGDDLIRQVQAEIACRGELQGGGMLLLDESAVDKAGTNSVGAGRQYSGRRGKVDNSQVGVFLTFAKGASWTWVDGEVFLPERWFGEAYAQRRERAGVSAERTFKTKIELGWQMLQRAQANGLPFEAVGCDTFYGRSGDFRDQMAGADIEYYADVPADTRVYLSEPQIGVPPSKKHGPKKRKERVLSPKAYRVDRLRHHSETLWQRIELRPSERGVLVSDFALRRVWTVREDLSIREEWLLFRRFSDGKCSYTLSNAPVDTPLTTLARRKAQRYFVERSIQDAKSELGWDEFQTIKFRAWEHQLALTILASWFITETKLDWAVDHARDPELLALYQVEVCPLCRSLMCANCCALLCPCCNSPPFKLANWWSTVWSTVLVLVNPVSDTAQAIWDPECDIVKLPVNLGVALAFLTFLLLCHAIA